MSGRGKIQSFETALDFGALRGRRGDPKSMNSYPSSSRGRNFLCLSRVGLVRLLSGSSLSEDEIESDRRCDTKGGSGFTLGRLFDVFGGGVLGGIGVGGRHLEPFGCGDDVDLEWAVWGSS